MAKKRVSSKKPVKRVSKADWLQCALEVLQEEGVQGVRVERLARDLGIAKAGFYWHFSNRDELLAEMLRYWAHEYTEVVTKGLPTLIGSPKKRLQETMKMIADHRLNKYELSMRSWAAIDQKAAKSVRKVYKMRLSYLRSIFEELGFRGTELEMRTKMFGVYFTMSPLMFPMGTKTRREALMKKQLDWFCKK